MSKLRKHLLEEAAEEMYEALKALVGVFEGHDDVPIYVRRARAALAKAEGRQS